MAVESSVQLDIEAAVPKPLWEPRHEWEARVKFVEDYVSEYGLEKATNLSLVWANMNYLGCSYPAGTEALVASYKVPSLEELRARRKCKNSIVKCKTTSAPQPTNFEEVSALLTSIHTQTSINATHPQLKTIANEMCLCKDCLNLSEKESYPEKGMKILQHLKKSRSDFVYELQEDNGVWSLVLNGEKVLNRNTSKELALEDFVKMLNNWQEANQKPACPLVGQQSSGMGVAYSSSPNTQYSDPYSSTDSPYQSSSGGYSRPYTSSREEHGTPSRGGYGSPHESSRGGYASSNKRGGYGSPYEGTRGEHSSPYGGSSGGRGNPYGGSSGGRGSPYGGSSGRRGSPYGNSSGGNSRGARGSSYQHSGYNHRQY